MWYLKAQTCASVTSEMVRRLFVAASVRAASAADGGFCIAAALAVKARKGNPLQRMLGGIGAGPIVGLALLGSTATALPAQPELPALQGAWLEQSLPCGEVFTPSGKGLGFRKPANMFAPAFIISGNRISTPFASCRITAVKPAGSRQALTLGCTTSIATADVRALLSATPDGALMRYLNDSDTVGSKYQRCTLKDVSSNPTNQ
jgi:hypothetical protein